MEIDNFNKKWGKHLESGHYGLAINNQDVIDFLDNEFEKEVEVNPDFKYAQIKIKFGSSRVYTNSEKDTEWESTIDTILFNNL